MKRYIYYRMSAIGRWTIWASEDYPIKKSVNGRLHNITQITEVAEEHQHLSLSELEKLYPLENQKTQA